MIKTDVLIIGGGPAGSACAWYLRRHNVDCLILDRETFPRVKLCAGWIQPEVIRDLEIDVATYPHTLMTFKKLHIAIKGVKFRLPTRQHAIRRVEFDHWLLQRAGVPVQTHHVRTIERTDDSYVVKFDDIDNDNKASEFLGCQIYLLKTLINQNNSAEYPVNLNVFKGYTVFDENTGKLGVVAGYHDIPSNPLLIIEAEDNEILVPFHEENILEINAEEKEIICSLPEGFLDLNVS